MKLNSVNDRVHSSTLRMCNFARDGSRGLLTDDEIHPTVWSTDAVADPGHWGLTPTQGFCLIVSLNILTDLAFRGPSAPPPFQECLDPPLRLTCAATKTCSSIETANHNSINLNKCLQTLAIVLSFLCIVYISQPYRCTYLGMVKKPCVRGFDCLDGICWTMPKIHVFS